MEKDSYNIINSICDIILVIILQIAIVFLIIFFPSLIIIMRSLKELGISSMSTLSISTTRNLLLSNEFMRTLIQFSRSLSILITPFVYEKLVSRRRDTTVAKDYLSGMKLHLKDLLLGGAIGLAFAVVIVLVNSLFFAKKIISPLFYNDSLSGYFLSIVFILISSVAFEFFARYYVKLKTYKYSKIIFVLLSGAVFLYCTYGVFQSNNVLTICTLLLYHSFLLLRIINNTSISKNIGFGIVSLVILYLCYYYFQIETITSSLVLAVLCLFEIIKRIRTSKKDESIQ